LNDGLPAPDDDEESVTVIDSNVRGSRGLDRAERRVDLISRVLVRQVEGRAARILLNLREFALIVGIHCLQHGQCAIAKPHRASVVKLNLGSGIGVQPKLRPLPQRKVRAGVAPTYAVAGTPNDVALLPGDSRHANRSSAARVAVALRFRSAVRGGRGLIRNGSGGGALPGRDHNHLFGRVPENLRAQRFANEPDGDHGGVRHDLGRYIQVHRAPVDRRTWVSNLKVDAVLTPRRNYPAIGGIPLDVGAQALKYPAQGNEDAAVHHLRSGPGEGERLAVYRHRNPPLRARHRGKRQCARHRKRSLAQYKHKFHF
jgi:hypothetical protein